MSMSLSFIGKFYNGKTRCIGSFVSTNGLNNSKLYLNLDDAMFIVKMSESGNNCFNWCLENNKFKEVIVYAYYEGGKIMEEKINLPLRRINKQIVAQYIEKANKKAKKQVQKEFNRSFKHLTEDEKEKVYLHWYIMQPINKTEEEKIKEFSSLIRENSRIDDHYNIIFNA